jgi:adenylate cyclase class IV
MIVKQPVSCALSAKARIIFSSPDDANPVTPDPHSTPVPTPGQNVELKARIADLDGAREIARRLCGGPAEVLRQVDTYFRCTKGRLKLREIDGRQAQLIGYERSDAAKPRTSDYHIANIADPAPLRAALVTALGVLVVVEKLREVSLYRNVRIHLDRVERLGTFLEFEAVLSPAQSRAEGEQLVQELSREFRLAPGTLIAGSYSDLVLALDA